MSKRSRRKTLSHADLEDFLCDIGEKAHSYRPDSVDIVESGSNQSARIENESSNKSTLQTISDEQRVREFCKLLAPQQGLANDARACEYARTLMLNTSYKILPARILYPETFEHPPESIESKKALLLSLKSMISDAEVLRLSDTNKCRDFTRCIVGKCKSKSAAFEYTDIDIESVITSEEYEKRYLMHLSSLRGAASKNVHFTTSYDSSSSSSWSSSFPINSENVDLTNIPKAATTGETLKDMKLKGNNHDHNLGERFSEKSSSRKTSSSSASSFSRRKARASILLPFFDDLESSSPDDSVKVNPKNMSRRMTLSPAAARSLMMEVMADNATTKCSTSEFSDSVFTSSYAIPVPTPSKSAIDPISPSSPIQHCELPSPLPSSHPTNSLPRQETSKLRSSGLKLVSDERVRKESSNVQKAETEALNKAAACVSVCGTSTGSTSQAVVASDSGESMSTATRTYDSHPCTYNADLDALLDSDSDTSSSTTSSALPLSPTHATSFSSSSGPSKSPMAVDISSSSASQSFTGFCEDPPLEQPTRRNTASSNKEKAEMHYFHEGVSFESLFPLPDSSPCRDILLDSSVEATALLNDSVSAVKVDIQNLASSFVSEKSVCERVTGLESSFSTPFLMINETNPRSDTERLSVCRSKVGSEEGMEAELNVRKRTEEGLEKMGSAKKSRKEDEEHSVVSETETSRTLPTLLTSPSISRNEAERRALCRMRIRQETAEWKYHWEVASYCAAQAAREKNVLRN